jgi:PAP2 superfamily
MSTASSSPFSASKRGFFSEVAGYGLATLVLRPLDVGAQVPTGLHKVFSTQAWLPLDASAMEMQTEAPTDSRSRDPSFWPGSSPSLRLTQWTRSALALIVKYQQNPLRACRLLAYLHVGMHDAWHHAGRAASPSSGNGATPGRAENAAHEAAALILAHFYPHETPGMFSALLAAVQASVPLMGDNARQASIGTRVATALIERSLRDGAGRVWPIKQRPADFLGIWQASYPLFAVNPTEAYAGGWKPWISPSTSRYVPPVAPRLGSVQHTAETEEVLTALRNLTATQTRAAQRWHLESGSVTPAGIWVGIALDALRRHEKTSHQSPETGAAVVLQTLSTLCATMHDALIACWAIKFRDWSERPITAVRRSKDSNFIPLLVTPGFPSYVSGHATVSAAAAHILGEQWPDQRSHFQAIAQEAADSRLWGGIHFRSDNEEGLKLGEAVGRDMVSARPATASIP